MDWYCYAAIAYLVSWGLVKWCRLAVTPADAGGHLMHHSPIGVVILLAPVIVAWYAAIGLLAVLLEAFGWEL